MPTDLQRHTDWIGTFQPEGLVVSAAVLADAGVYVRQPQALQQALRDICAEGLLESLEHFGQLARDVLGWPLEHVWKTDEDLLNRYRLDLPDLDATLKPDAVVVSPGGDPLLLLTWVDDDPDRVQSGTRWPVSPQERFERLLVELQAADDSSVSTSQSAKENNTPAKGSGPSQGGSSKRGVSNGSAGATPVGLLVYPEGVRLTYAPRGEAPGHLTFAIRPMLTGDGRLLVDAFVMMLGKARLFTGHPDERLRPLLEQSRNRQEDVTVALGEQVEEALEILLAGFDLANARGGGALFAGMDNEAGREHIYHGLITVLLRLVFLLYAEDRGLMPTDVSDGVYANHYSVTGLADRLAEDRLLHPEAMDRRFGAWGQLLALFRMVFSGATHGSMIMPPRRGELFDPARYPFLEGRPRESTNWRNDPVQVPPVDDDTIEHVLARLIHLQGQRISYRTLDVEQIGSVYEALMGFSLVRTHGPAIRVKPDGRVVEIDDVIEAKNPVRAVADAAGVKTKDVKKKAEGLKEWEPSGDRTKDRETLEELLAPMRKRQSRSGSPLTIQPGHHVLQPGEERRRTGSHYTPRSLTEPIVERTLRPVLFGQQDELTPSPADILGLKVCDPAMGSGAFLAAACRYLSERLVEAWTRTESFPPAVEDSDALLVARRLVVERCLYGVDKNPFAVTLARMSLWLITLSRDLPFTFVDHALREGDAIVGLDVDQIGSFSFDGQGADPLFSGVMKNNVKSAVRSRASMLEVEGYDDKRRVLDDAYASVSRERLLGDLLIACVWEGGTKGTINKRIREVKDKAQPWYSSFEDIGTLDSSLRALRETLPFRPFHWWLEFPEVFERSEKGFDAIIGNPPFGGKNTIIAQSGDMYIKLLQRHREHAHGNSDLVAHFFIRAVDVLRDGGCFGLIGTNTTNQGNTRSTGLQYLATERETTFYHVTTDMDWPVRAAAVVVHVIHGCNGEWQGPQWLDGEVVEYGINSELKDDEEWDDPLPLSANDSKSFAGTNPYGAGFFLEMEEAEALLAEDPRRDKIVRPFVGGKELNEDPELRPQRYIIDFGERSLDESSEWPELLRIVRERVKPLRDGTKRRHYREKWWQFAERRVDLYQTISSLNQCIVCSQTSRHHLLAFQSADYVFYTKTVVFPFDDYYHFSLLQCVVHEVWARDAGLGSTLHTRPVYTPSRIFGTFPFPRCDQSTRNKVAEAGQALYDARSSYMEKHEVGMTETWNRLLEPDNPEYHSAEIEEIRRLKDAMDRAVLEAYGWGDLEPGDREEIVRRLRRLNVERAQEEAAAAEG